MDNQNNYCLFGDNEDTFIDVLEKVCKLMDGIKYAFPHADALKEIYKKDLQLGEMMYMFNVIQNCHFAACASLLRTQRWFEGVRYGLERGNFLIFSSSLRGLVESTSDSYDVMRYIGKTLEVNYIPFVLALLGKKTKDGEVVLNDTKPLDVLVNHFIYAKEMSDYSILRKTNGMSPEEAERYKDIHKAKKPWEYRRILKEQGFPHVDTIYSELSETTHPASSSVFLFLQENKDGTYNLKQDSDYENISEFIRKFGKKTKDLLSYAITPSLIALKTVDEFPIHGEPFKSIFPTVLNIKEIATFINLDNVQAWVDTKASIDLKRSEEL